MTELLVFAGAFLGGFSSGLTGFGFALSALPFWTLVLAPSASAPLVVVCSLAAQAQTLPAIWRAIDFRRLAPFVICGLLGVPLGVLLLPLISPKAFRIGLGIVLIFTCALFLWLRVEKRRDSSRVGDGAVGFLGGILGGLIGLSGVLPTIWAELHGWAKEERRAIFQGFNVAILLLALAVQLFAGMVTASLLPLILIAVPSCVVGARVGHWLYKRVDAKKFSRVILVLLMFAGAGLVVTALRN